MTTLQTPEQSARGILAILVWHFGLLAGDILLCKSFLPLWRQRGYRPMEFKAGAQFAVDAGWLEMRPDGKSYRLTKSGFADA